MYGLTDKSATAILHPFLLKILIKKSDQSTIHTILRFFKTDTCLLMRNMSLK